MDFIWINDTGDVIHKGGYNHINAISDQPELFGLTRKLIKDTYRRFKEPTGTEGKAREYLMKAVMKNGWIRGRMHDGTWIFETWNLTDTQKNTIYMFIMTGNQVKKYDNIIITNVSINNVQRYEDKQEFKKNFLIQ